MNKNDLTVLVSLREVFLRPSYVFLLIIFFLIVIVFSVWLPNITFLAHTATSDTFTPSQKFGIIFSTIGGFQTNFNPLSRTFVILVALLFAINTCFLIFYVLRAAKLSLSAGLGTGGFMLGLIGVGCVSCGSVILTAFLGIGATAGFIGILPLKGVEFGILSVVILSFSVYHLAKKIKDPLVCRAKPATFKSLMSFVPIWLKILVFIAIAFIAGIVIAGNSLDKAGIGINITKEALAAKFEKLSQNGNSSCSTDFKESISEMPDTSRLQGSCCSPMDLHRYSEQIEGLKKYSNIKEIPPDPYDIEVQLAKKLISYYDESLTASEQKEYDFAMQNSMEKGPCCCKCWRWYVYGGLAKVLIQKYNFTGEQITEVWNLSDGCGGKGDHVNHES